MICNITDFSFQHIPPMYTCDIGLSVGGYFGIDDRLSVLPVLPCDVCSASADTFSSIALYIVLFCEFSLMQSANIVWYFNIFSISVLPVMPILTGTYNLKSNIF